MLARLLYNPVIAKVIRAATGHIRMGISDYGILRPYQGSSGRRLLEATIAHKLDDRIKDGYSDGANGRTDVLLIADPQNIGFNMPIALCRAHRRHHRRQMFKLAHERFVDS
jgi:hypothetical protein